ncbi:MAG: alpha/beta hydrolase, partial [Pseudomonadota bacterium]
TIARWTKAGDLSPFHSDALAEYREAFADRAHLAASCDDYRAGATIDRAHDDASRAAGDTIAAPTLVLWGAASIASGGGSPLDVWRTWSPLAKGAGVDSGHFVCEEAPREVLTHLAPFLADAAR